MSRSEFHHQHAERATAEARRLLEHREILGPRWLAWVATELYQLKPPEFAAMVRRELARLNEA
ncbi:hypothetical protein MT1_3291 [Pseudomonas sp. MT-1]|uniref:hypothetical protein n=1 Tax=Stutzerimonas stutzeri TaxID=316 RepID=UPI000535AAAD|nr:hypothetical protein [Stutzerimonas stutzeri]MCQ4282763.1 hypothetical protein [Stutzerimonas stutzeri]BAP80466.1 hypothetical protein MT1_3291 [Pseudomonas sp. MT-1]